MIAEAPYFASPECGASACPGYCILLRTCYTGIMNRVSDDKKPMTGTWYRDAQGALGKVVHIDREKQTCGVIASGGRWLLMSWTEFAQKWELS